MQLRLRRVAGARRVAGFGQWRGEHGAAQLAAPSRATSRGMTLALSPCCSRSSWSGTGHRTLRRPAVLRFTGGAASRIGTLKGKKAHGWIGCAASETAAVHYGLVSGAKPCSWAASPRSASPRHLATGGVGRVEEGADSGRCAVRSVPPHPEVLYSQPVSRFRTTPRGRVGARQPFSAACCKRLVG
jgi:hypothetical protein